jgi:signal transduction histidine kinase
MRVGQRLFLAVVPAVLGVLTVAGLAYWGQYAHTAPEWLVAIAILASVVSLVIAWLNTRYVAGRVERLAGRRLSREASTNVLLRAAALLGDVVPPRGADASGSGDELDEIEILLDRLSQALEVAKAKERDKDAALQQQRSEYAEILASAAGVATQQLEEVRLPLHILLENRFGDLNENQEEMLGAARSAAETADLALVRLRRLADLDRGVVTLRRDPVRLGDVLASLLPALRAEAERVGVRVNAEIAPVLPLIQGDRPQLQQALSILLHDSVIASVDNGQVTIEAGVNGAALRLRVTHGTMHVDPLQRGLARRLLVASGGAVSWTDGATEVSFPR